VAGKEKDGMSEFKPDWDIREAALESIREHQQIVKELQQKVGRLSDALRKLMGGLDTCHICGASLELPARGAAHCEDCPSGCECHDAPDCESLADLYEQARSALDESGVSK
jgi:hypothetical protein